MGIKGAGETGGQIIILGPPVGGNIKMTDKREIQKQRIKLNKGAKTMRSEQDQENKRNVKFV